MRRPWWCTRPWWCDLALRRVCGLRVGGRARAEWRLSASGHHTAELRLLISGERMLEEKPFIGIWSGYKTSLRLFRFCFLPLCQWKELWLSGYTYVSLQTFFLLHYTTRKYEPWYFHTCVVCHVRPHIGTSGATGEMGARRSRPPPTHSPPPTYPTLGSLTVFHIF